MDALTVTLTHLDTKKRQFHRAHVCMPFAGAYRSSFRFPRVDWNFFLILIAQRWRAQLEKLDEYHLMNTSPAEMRWDVSHHKRTILELRGEQFVVASCASDRAAMVLRWTADSTAADPVWIELGHLYFAMGLPHQHPHQMVALAVCKGLFVAKALSRALVLKGWWSPPLVISSSGGDHDDELRNLWTVSEPEIDARPQGMDLPDQWSGAHSRLTELQETHSDEPAEVLAVAINQWLAGALPQHRV